MNAKIFLTKLISVQRTKTTPDGKQLNMLIVPIAENNLINESVDKVLLNFVCFEKASNGIGLDTHILKQDFTDHQKAKLGKEAIEAMPILGNLLDWDKIRDASLPKTIVSGSVNLRALESVIMPFRNKAGQYTSCLVFDTSKNHLYHHDNGDLSLSLLLFAIKNPRGSATHTIRLSVDKHIYEAMSPAEQSAIPFLGSATQRNFQPVQANNDNNLAQILNDTSADFAALNDPFGTISSDDLPF